MPGKSKIYAIVLLTVCLMSFLLGGCDIIDGLTNKGIQELMQPPALTGDYEQIKQALENSLYSSFSLRSPSSGDHRSAYTIFNIDSDDSNEAIVFYKQKTDLYLGFLDKKDGSWVMKQSIKSNGCSDVYSVGFYDLDNNDVKEIVVIWEKTTNDTMRTLEVYKFNGDELVIAGESVDCSEAVVVDMIPDNDGLEILMFTVDRIASIYSNPMARLYTYDISSGVLKFRSSKQLNDTLAIGYANVVAAPQTEVNSVTYNPVVVVDSYSGGYDWLETEIISWDAEKETLSGTERSYKRQSTVTSMDVNNDGLIEIPTLLPFNNTNKVGWVDPEYLTTEYIIAWVDYDETIIKHSVVNQEFNYMLVIPEQWCADSAFVENSSENEYIIYKWDIEKNKPRNDKYGGIYMSTKVFTLSEWNDYVAEYTDSSENKYSLVKIYGSLVYAIRFGAESVDRTTVIEIIK